MHMRIFGLPLFFVACATGEPVDTGASDTGVMDTGEDTGEDTGDESGCDEDLPYASELISFEPGPNAGFGQEKLPDVVLGEPLPGSPNSGSMDVLSLGVGGEIVLGFGDRIVENGAGVDLVVWENAFFQNGDPDNPFAELGEVSVSMDGEEWHVFSCDPTLSNPYDSGCAGWRPRKDFDPCAMIPIEPESVGGDAFDLADLGLEEIRYVRIRDLAEEGEGTSAGFDLDAVGAVYLSP